MGDRSRLPRPHAARGRSPWRRRTAIAWESGASVDIRRALTAPMSGIVILPAASTAEELLSAS